MDVLFIEGATFLPNLVKIGQELRERHQLSKTQDGSSRHLEFRLQVFFNSIDELFFKVTTFPTTLVGVGKK